MASSPHFLLWWLLVLSSTGWLLVSFASKGLAWLLGKALKANVSFQIDGLFSVKDLTIQFNRGPISSVAIGDINLDLLYPFAWLGIHYGQSEPKLQLSLLEVDIFLQKPKKSARRNGSRAKKVRNPDKVSSTFKYWAIVAKIGRYCSLAVSDFVVRLVEIPNASLEIESVDLDAFDMENCPKDTMGLRLVVAPIQAHVRDMRFDNEVLDLIYSQQPTMGLNRDSCLFSLDHFTVTSSLDIGKGLVVRDTEVSLGDAAVNLTEELLFGENGLMTKFSSKKQSSGVLPQTLLDEPKTEQLEPEAEQAGKSHVVAPEEFPATTRTKKGKGAGMIPDKILFTLPNFTFEFCQKDDGPVMRNKIAGISLRTAISKPARKTEDQGGEVWDTLLECGEICILEDTQCSLFGISRVSVSAIVELQPALKLNPRVKIDANVEGTYCNLYLRSVDEILKFCLRLPKKAPKSAQIGIDPPLARPTKEPKSKLSWVCTVSVPDIVLSAFDSDGTALHKVRSQSLQLLVDSVSGPASRMQVELWELEVLSLEEVDNRMTFGRETTPSQFFRLGTLVVEWGKDAARVEDAKDVKPGAVLIVELIDIVLQLSAARIQYLLSVALSAKEYMKRVLGDRMKKRPKDPSTSLPKKKRSRMRTEFGVRCFSVQFTGPAVVDEGDVPDPKTVNYGDQGGRVVISKTEDGSLRTANVRATDFYMSRKGDLVGRGTFEIASGLVTYDDEKKDVRVLLDRAELHHKDLDSEGLVISKTSLLLVQNASVLYEGSNSAACLPARLLLSMKGLDGHWNPDVHLFYHDMVLQLVNIGKGWSGKIKEPKSAEDQVPEASDKGPSTASSVKSTESKQKLRIAVDLEKLNVTAKAAEEANFGLHIQYLISEDVEIGFLVQQIALDANKAQFLRVEHGQCCRLPWVSHGDFPEAYPSGQVKRDWKLVIQAKAIHTAMPYRLGFMALDYAAEDMERVLRLAMKMQKSKWTASSSNVAASQPKKKQSSSQIQLVEVSVEELHFEIEEEPIQGWLDEHYHLKRKEVCELLVREKLIEEKQKAEGIQHSGGLQSHINSEVAAGFRGEGSEWEKLQKEAFSSYKKACESLVLEEVSKAWKGPLQSGFRVSRKRRSLLSAKATHVKAELTLIKGSIIEAARRLDCVGELQVPYAKCFGRHLNLQSSSLLVNLRDYALPLLSTGFLDCEGDVVIAQQATAFPPQYRMEVPLGQLRVVEVWRSISGATPAYKTFLDLVIQSDVAEISYGVGYEPLFADLSYAFSVALAKAKSAVPVVKKERSLPWWDDMRYYIHGKNTLKVKTFKWTLQATTDPYEDQEILDMVANNFELEQSEGSIVLNTGEFKWFMMQRKSGFQASPSADSLDKLCLLHSPGFKTEILMVWDCESGNPFQHYLHPFPADPNPPSKRFDLFRSTSLSLTFAFSLLNSPVTNTITRSGQSLQRMMGMKSKSSLTRPGQILGGFRSSQQTDSSVREKQGAYPTFYFGADELAWIFKLWNLLYLPPQKIRTFSRWPRFGVPRIPRSGNLALDKVMTENLLRVEATPGCIKHISPQPGDPAEGLTFTMKKLRYEVLYSRCQTSFDSFSPREPLLGVYQGLDITVLNAVLDKTFVSTHCNGRKEGEYDREDKVKELLGLQEDFMGPLNDNKGTSGSMNDRGFLLSMDSLTLRRQAPKADKSQLSSLLHYKRLSRSDKALVYIPENAGNGSDPARSDASDDESLVVADNCLRVSVYGSKLLWTLSNRDAVWAWSYDLARAFETPKPSPSRQAAQQRIREWHESQSSEASPKPSVPAVGQSADTTQEEEELMHFRINVVQPQFNLDSEDAHGRLLLAAATGKVLARSFHSIVAVAPDAIANVLAQSGVVVSPQGVAPMIAWKRRELSVMLEQVQAHVAPTDVDLGAGLQWLPKVPTGDFNRAPKVRRTGTLLERVFIPCDMYFRYTRHKGGTTDVKVKPLKELSFNSSGITATMTSNQFHIMMDVITNLLLARLPKPQKRPSVHQISGEVATEEDGEEEVDEVVPEGVEEVEVARIKLEQAERECQAIVSHCGALRRLGYFPESAEIQALARDFGFKCKERKTAAVLLRAALKRAAEQRLAEKEKNRSPLAAMRISWTIAKIGWNMLCDGESFAEAEIDSMILEVDRNFDDIGVAKFTTKSFVVRNCLQGAKSSRILSPWNPPAGDDWGKNVMLRVDAKQGAPKDGHSPLELFQVDIYPLKIHLTESMYKMMWDYLFPEEEHEVQRQSVRTQHQKLSLTMTATSGGSRDGRLVSRDEEVESLMDDCNSRMSVRSSTSSLQVSLPDDNHGSSMNATTTAVETVKIKEQKTRRGKVVAQEEKRVTEEKKVTRAQKSVLEFYNIRISQVELLVTYEGSRFSVVDLRLLLDTFARESFSGSWRRLFSKVKKHIIWSVLKSVTGMQGKKFKDKLPAGSHIDILEAAHNSSDSDSSSSQSGHDDQFPIGRYKKHSDRAGEGFVSSIKGLFNSQRRKAAKNLGLKKLTSDLRTSTESVGYMSGNDLDTITSLQDYDNLDNKPKRLGHRHSRKRTSAHAVFGMPSPSSSSSSTQHADGDNSDASSAYEDQVIKTRTSYTNTKVLLLMLEDQVAFISSASASRAVLVEGQKGLWVCPEVAFCRCVLLMSTKY
ncbi:hypothetical protein R1flu_022586 [Riccia fluitans]|uniref:FMP27/BLTP2/Hobbit GFWDK motif-containing RBG unit domain-containing protein n=1 Tax=Riccia fluitans TaxID=41844 RepID=A0ABD1XPN5_9MARC